MSERSSGRRPPNAREGWEADTMPAKRPWLGLGGIVKELRAFLLSPVAAAILGAIVSWASGGFPRPISVAIFYLLQLYVAQLLFGVAIRAFLLKTNRRSIINFFFGGIVMTGVPSAAYLAWAASQNPNSVSKAVVVLLLWMLLGGLTGLAYWRLTRPAVIAPATA